MSPGRKSFLVFIVLIMSAGWIYYADGFAIDKTNRYRPLANGWVSAYADVHLQKDTTLVEKIKFTVSSDYNCCGRFRPAFFFYSTIGYALSPLLHGRSVEGEGRPYNRLVNGDLRIYSFVLLTSIAVSYILLSLLIFKMTGEFVFSLLAVIFIPLSPSLTENLLHNYIDSQEIPLVFFLSLWLFGLFAALLTKRKWLKTLVASLSVLFLVAAFMTKETALVVTVALFMLLIFNSARNWLEKRGNYIKTEEGGLILLSLLVAFICSLVIYGFVAMHKQEYATNYARPSLSLLISAVGVLWHHVTAYSLVNFFGLLPMAAIITLVCKERNKEIRQELFGKPFSLLFFLLLLATGFLLILAPWQPILIKYLFPTIFFFTFAVVLSLSLLSAWAKRKYGRKKGLMVYLLILPFLFLYGSYREKAADAQSYWSESAAYGLSVIDDLADSITPEITVQMASRKPQSVFVDYGTYHRWMDKVHWAKLHLERILNLDKGFNIMDSEGEMQLNDRMPGSELTSFRHYENGPCLYLENDPAVLDIRKFDVLFMAYGRGEKNEAELSFPSADAYYRATGEQIDYWPRPGFPPFSLFKYLPANNRDAEKEYAQADPANLVMLSLSEEDSIQGLHDVIVEHRDKGILLTSTGDDPQVLLPPVEQTDETWVVVRMKIYSETASTLQLYFKSRERPFYNERDSRKMNVAVGENDLYLMLSTRQAWDRIRLDPGHAGSKMILRSFEVRRVIVE